MHASTVKQKASTATEDANNQFRNSVPDACMTRQPCQVKRLSEGRVHLQSGRELSVRCIQDLTFSAFTEEWNHPAQVQTILKVFGFVGDQEAMLNQGLQWILMFFSATGRPPPEDQKHVRLLGRALIAHCFCI